jgi:hypothetical protein
MEPCGARVRRGGYLTDGCVAARIVDDRLVRPGSSGTWPLPPVGRRWPLRPGAASVRLGNARACPLRDRGFADSPLEGDGFELSVKIRPEENCGFPGPRHQHNSTPNRGEIVSKKGAPASQRLIPSLAHDTAPFICWGNWVSLLNAVGLSEIPTQTTGVGRTGTGHKDA